jgi:hypothetical protein
LPYAQLEPTSSPTVQSGIDQFDRLEIESSRVVRLIPLGRERPRQTGPDPREDEPLGRPSQGFLSREIIALLRWPCDRISADLCENTIAP